MKKSVIRHYSSAILLLFIILLAGCTSDAWMGPDLGPVPEAYIGDSSMTKRMHRELTGSYFNEVDGNMEVTVHASLVYDFEYHPKLIDGKLLYSFEVWIADPQRDYLRAVSDIMDVLNDPLFPQEDRGKLDVGLFYDRRHAQ